jgi:hypothetical protein
MKNNKTVEELATEFHSLNPYSEDIIYGFISGYNLANQKFQKAKELLEYFTNRVEEGSIISKTTYKLYKEFLENN